MRFDPSSKSGPAPKECLLGRITKQRNLKEAAEQEKDVGARQISAAPRAIQQHKVAKCLPFKPFSWLIYCALTLNPVRDPVELDSVCE